MVAIVLVLIGRLPVTHMHVSINNNLLLGYQMYCIADMLMQVWQHFVLTVNCTSYLFGNSTTFCSHFLY